MTQEQLHQLALVFCKGIGAVTARTLISYCGSATAIFNQKKSQLLKIPGIGQITIDKLNGDESLKAAEDELALMQKNQIHFCFYLDPIYPERLKMYPNAPIGLFYKGSIEKCSKKTVAIIGTRSPSEYGIQMTEKITDGLQAYDVNIISGMAYGIDTTAHKKSLEKGLTNYAVLGNGLQKVYPSTNYLLAEKVIANGALISEFPFYTQPERVNFPKRNRIIAGMSDAVVVVESKAKGGSMITANYANDYFKDVFAVPGRINDVRSKGCIRLIKEHKAALLESAKDIGYIMNWEKENDDTKQMVLPLDLKDDELMIYERIKEQQQSQIDELHYHLNIPLSKISSLLLSLEFKGLIKSLPGKKYMLN